nr:unnamed protein product [Callosobruchus analis]
MEKSKISWKQHQVIYEAIGSKSFSCYICNYTAFSKHHLIDHMNVHDNKNHCNVTFASKIRLDEHIIRKHPNFSSSVTSKLHECTKCTFKTVIKSYLDKHLLKHPSNFKLSVCINCNTTFKSKKSLDHHVLRKHPDFFTTVTSKLYECTDCTFKTVIKSDFDKHLLKHSDFKYSACVHCNATFKSKKSLDDHVLRKHPDFFTAVTYKVHECIKCSFKTIIKRCFDRHLLNHPELQSTCGHCNATFKSKKSLDDHVLRKHPGFFTAVTYKVRECKKCSFKTIIKRSFDRHLLNHHLKHSTCIHCNVTFTNKFTLDNHVVRKHPEFITTVARKIYECPKCTYKTTFKNTFKRHISSHSVHSCSCSHCDASFRDKRALDEHVIRKHPNFMSSVTGKLHECTKCTYKTVRKRSLDKHLLNHHFKHITCVHCNAAFKSKATLDDHVVRRHPDFSTTVTSKVHKCTKCTFKAVKKDCFDKHFLKHLGITCVHCNATFKSKIVLDHHVLRKHPDFISSVTSKLHECTECAYKTVIKSYFDKHLLKHSDFAQHMRG